MSVQELVTKATFARLAQVSAGRVTRLCSTELKAAIVGRRIDAAHASAIAYLAKQEAKRNPPPDNGLDDRYDEAVKHCTVTGVWNANAVQQGLGFRSKRAKAIFDTMVLLKVIPDDWEVLKPLKTRKSTKLVEPAKPFEIVMPDDPPSEPVLHEVPEEIMEYAGLTIREVVTQFGTMQAFQDHLKAIQTMEVIHGTRLKNATTERRLVSRDVVENFIIGPIDTMLVKMLGDLPKTLAVRIPARHNAGDDVSALEKAIRKMITGYIKPMKKNVGAAISKELGSLDRA